jgi:hypothetical protein
MITMTVEIKNDQMAKDIMAVANGMVLTDLAIRSVEITRNVTKHRHDVSDSMIATTAISEVKQKLIGER